MCLKIRSDVLLRSKKLCEVDEFGLGEPAVLVLMMETKMRRNLEAKNYIINNTVSNKLLISRKNFYLVKNE